VEPFIYALRALTTLLCAVLLSVGYARAKQRLLLWSGLCFAGLALSNALVFVDLVLMPQVDLFRWRLGTAIVGMCFLLYGLIWERR
jgi:Family of unknown function (DUF5985)